MSDYSRVDVMCLTAGWCVAGLLWLVAVRVGVRHATRLPPPETVDLDAYGLASLAGLADPGGSPARLRDAALACRAVRASQQAGPLDEEHRVEVLIAAADGRQKEWSEAVALDTAYQRELVRLGLRHDPLRLLGLVPATVVTAAMFAACLAVMALAGARPGEGLPPVRAGVFFAHVLGLCVTVFLFKPIGVGYISRRGLAVLAAARQSHGDLRDVARRPGRVSPAEIAFAVALFGLQEWSDVPPLAELYGRLYPPSGPPPGG